ncbi:putative Dedicator of cytokinesis protein 9 [Blattamonas nauphoetae]|uniref:Dedicator of cytokinesis protein 9 n=1 Tax=Blattamonas nauphoetae TaxID=2049346 RepID=A0ABQ9YG98_9EUKA|nr:putative Dedicator of cytokinesis protein 9 [Blattamonas nauphoetae]
MDGTSNPSEYFRSLTGCQSSLERLIDLLPKLPDCISKEPVTVTVNEEASTVNWKAFNAQFSSVPESFRPAVSVFTKPDTKIKFDQPSNDPEPIHYPSCHYPQNYPLPTTVIDDEELTGDSEQTPSGQENIVDDPESEQPPPATPNPGEDEVQIERSYKDRDFIQKGEKTQIAGRQICGMLFQNTQPELPPLSVTGLFNASTSAKIREHLYVRLSSIRFERALIDDVEPMYVIFSLYQFDPLRKLSEDVHMDLNKNEVLTKLGNVHSDSDPLTALTRAIFTIDPSIAHSVYLVITLHKVISSDDEFGTQDYISNKYQKFRELPENHKERVEKLSHYNSLLEFYGKWRSLMSFGAIPIIEDGDWTPSINGQPFTADRPTSIQFTNMYIPKVKELLNDGVVGMIQTVLKKNTAFERLPVSIGIELMYLRDTKPANVVGFQYEIEQDTLNEQDEEINPLLKINPIEDPITIASKRIRRAVSFLPPPLPLTSNSLYHFVFISPLFVDTSQIDFRSRNVALRVRVLERDTSSQGTPLPIILSRSHSSLKVSEYWCEMQYHTERPRFFDEIKIALPFDVPPTMHVLFELFHISLQYYEDVKKGKEKGRELMKPIGAAALPLTPLGLIVDDRPRPLRVCKPQELTHYLSNLTNPEDKNLQYYTGKVPPELYVQTRLVSSLVPLNNDVRSVLMQQHTDEKEEPSKEWNVNQKESIQSFDFSSSLQEVIEETPAEKASKEKNKVDFLHMDQTLTSLRQQSAVVFFPALVSLILEKMKIGGDKERIRLMSCLIDMFDLAETTRKKENMNTDTLADFVENRYDLWNTKQKLHNFADYKKNEGEDVEKKNMEGKGELEKDAELMHEVLVRMLVMQMLAGSFHQLVTFISHILKNDAAFSRKHPDLTEEATIAMAIRTTLGDSLGEMLTARDPVFGPLLSAKKASKDDDDIDFEDGTVRLDNSVIAPFKAFLDMWVESALFAIRPENSRAKGDVIDEEPSEATTKTKPLFVAIPPAYIVHVLKQSKAPKADGTNPLRPMLSLLSYSKVFFSLILKSMILSVYYLSTLSSRHDSRFSSSLYDRLRSLTILFSLGVQLHLTVNSASSFIASLAHFYSQLWTIGDRGQTNELILCFVTWFQPVLAQSTPQAIEDEKPQPSSEVSTPRSMTQSQVFSVPSLPTASILSQSTLSFRTNKILTILLKFWTVLTRSPQWVRMVFFSGGKSKEDQQKHKFQFFLTHLLTESIFSSQVIAFSLSDVGTLAIPTPGASPMEDEDDFGLADSDGAVENATASSRPLPFLFIQQLFSRFDSYAVFSSSFESRSLIARIHFSFFSSCVNRKEEVLDNKSLPVEEKLNCFMSCAWLLMNSPSKVITSYLLNLHLSNYDSLVSLLFDIFSYAQPSFLSTFVRSKLEEDEKAILDRLKEIKEEKDWERMKEEREKAMTMKSKKNTMKFSQKDLMQEKIISRRINDPRSKTVRLSMSFQNAQNNMQKWNTMSQSYSGLPGSHMTMALPKSTGFGSRNTRSPQRPTGPVALASLFVSPGSSPQTSRSPIPASSPFAGHATPTNSPAPPMSPALNASMNRLSATVTTSPLRSLNMSLSQSMSGQMPSETMLFLMDSEEEARANLESVREWGRQFKDSVSHICYSVISRTVVATLFEFTGLKTHYDPVQSGWPETGTGIKYDKNPSYFGEYTIFESILNYYDETPDAEGGVRWKIGFENVEQLGEAYARQTRMNYPHLNLNTIYDFLVKIFSTVTNRVQTVPETMSEESLLQLFDSLHFLLKLSSHAFFTESVDHAKGVVYFILSFFKASSPVLRASAISLIYFLFKQNMIVTNKINRMRRLITAFVSESDLNEEEQKNWQYSIKELVEYALNDSDKSDILVEQIRELNDRLVSILEDKAEVRRIGDTDDELKAERAFQLTKNYFHSPELRLGTYSQLETILKGKGSSVACPDELAISHVTKCAIQLDILSEIWRRQHDTLAKTVPFPQELPIRSTFVRFEQGNLEIQRGDFSEKESDDDFLLAPPAPSLPVKRRYGTGWCAWDVLLKRIIPDFVLYSPAALNQFYTNTDLLDAIEESGQYTIDKLTEQLVLTARKLDEAKLFEYSLPIRTILASIYTATNNLDGLQTAYSDLSQNASGTLSLLDSRLTCMHYRVGLFGHDFGDENGTLYITRQYNFMKIGDFKFKLIDKYKKKLGKEPKILMGDIVPELTDEELETPHIQLGAVRPLFSDYDKQDRPTEFLQKTLLRTFVMETPFTQTPIKKPGMHETWLRKVTFECEHPLPWVTSRVKVIPNGVKVEEISPAMFSSRDLDTKTMAIRKATDPLDQKGIQPLVSGAIAPQVNEGVMSIYRCFLGEHRNETSEEDQEAIKTSFFEFFMACRAALVKMPEIKNLTVGFVDTLAEKYNELMDEVQDELGKLPRIVPGVDFIPSIQKTTPVDDGME